MAVLFFLSCMNEGLQENLDSDRKAKLALIKKDMYVSEFFKLLLKVDKRINPHLYGITNGPIINQDDRHSKALNTKRGSTPK